jgi:Xaa-Pro dipeptidase
MFLDESFTRKGVFFLFTERRNRLVSWLQKSGTQGLIVMNPKHIYYLSGLLIDPHERFACLALSRDGEVALVVPALEAEKAAQYVDRSQVFTYKDGDVDFLPTHVKNWNGNPIAIEFDTLTVNRYMQFQTIWDKSNFVDCSKTFADIRLCKDASEIALIEAACKTADEAVEIACKTIAPGVKEVDVVAEIEYQMKKRGVEGMAFATMVLAGEQAANPHGVPSERTFQTGDLVIVDLGTLHQGYCSDITRTFAIGDISEQAKRQYDVVLAAQLKGLSVVEIGKPLRIVDIETRNVIEQAGYGEYFIHRTGHGMGMDVHESPYVHDRADETMRDGMVFSIEPGVYIPQVAGVRIEDTVVIQNGKGRALTQFPKELIVL